MTGKIRDPDAPYTDELDIYVDGERLLERDALLPADLVRARVHLVCERYLLMVARGEHADLVNHSCKRARRVRPTREAKDADLVTSLVC